MDNCQDDCLFRLHASQKVANVWISDRETDMTDVKQMSRKDLMKLATDAARAELQERNDRVRAGREVIAAMKRERA